jgi:hypothetical protein
MRVIDRGWENHPIEQAMVSGAATRVRRGAGTRPLKPDRSLIRTVTGRDSRGTALKPLLREDPRLYDWPGA